MPPYILVNNKGATFKDDLVVKADTIFCTSSQVSLRRFRLKSIGPQFTDDDRTGSRGLSLRGRRVRYLLYSPVECRRRLSFRESLILARHVQQSGYTSRFRSEFDFLTGYMNLLRPKAVN